MPRTATKPRAPAELLEYSNHVLYDIEMFGGTGPLISDGSTESLARDERIRQHALIESSFMHARSLMRFLYPTTGARPDDMSAKDYLLAGATLPVKWERFDQDLKQIDQELAHLTYERSATGAQWSFLAALTTALGEFVNSVAPDRVGKDFKPRARRALIEALGVPVEQEPAAEPQRD